MFIFLPENTLEPGKRRTDFRPSLRPRLTAVKRRDRTVDIECNTPPLGRLIPLARKVKIRKLLACELSRIIHFERLWGACILMGPSRFFISRSQVLMAAWRFSPMLQAGSQEHCQIPARRCRNLRWPRGDGLAARSHQIVALRRGAEDPQLAVLML